MTSPERTAVNLTKEQIEAIRAQAIGLQPGHDVYGMHWWRDVEILCDMALASLSERQQGQIGHSAPSTDVAGVARNEALEEAEESVPNTWLDNLFSGPDKVVGPAPYTGSDIEALCKAIKKRIRALQSPKDTKEG